MTTQREEDLAEARTQSAPGESVAAEAARTGRFAALGQGLQQMLAFGTLIALVIIFFIASPKFLTISNLSSILLSTAVIGILAVGTTFVIITGGIDLSLGTAMTLC
jgi:ribose transport system permease protein